MDSQNWAESGQEIEERKKRRGWSYRAHNGASYQEIHLPQKKSFQEQECEFVWEYVELEMQDN
jgi:hypothetical protein